MPRRARGAVGTAYHGSNVNELLVVGDRGLNLITAWTVRGRAGSDARRAIDLLPCPGHGQSYFTLFENVVIQLQPLGHWV